jgi:hypothetical protein
MDPVEQHLQQTIRIWTGAAPGSYTPASQLRDIWSVPGENYEPVGINKLMTRIYADSLFKSCMAAHNLTPNRFFTGGDLQTYLDLYLALLGCDPAVQSSVTSRSSAATQPVQTKTAAATASNKAAKRAPKNSRAGA